MSLLVGGAFVIGRASAKGSLPEKREPIPTPKPPKDNLPLPNNPPHKPNPPPREGKLQLAVCYFGKIEQNHMWFNIEDGEDHKVILVNEKNPMFSNKELTKKGQFYTITFLAQNAEKYDNKVHIYYFSKNNNKFTLKSKPENPKTEVKITYAGQCDKNEVAFNNLHKPNIKKEDIRLFCISKNHPRIKQLLSEGKLQRKKEFIIRYGKVDDISERNLMYTFNEFNQELEIIET